jgi:hypothetical protein
VTAYSLIVNGKVDQVPAAIQTGLAAGAPGPVGRRPTDGTFQVGTLAAIWLAMLTAESAGSALHVLTSMRTLFRCASAWEGHEFGPHDALTSQHRGHSALTLTLHTGQVHVKRIEPKFGVDLLIVGLGVSARSEDRL